MNNRDKFKILGIFEKHLSDALDEISVGGTSHSLPDYPNLVESMSEACLLVYETTLKVEKEVFEKEEEE